MDLEVFKTGDGSITLYNRKMNETYHSKFGAVNESMHVFIKEGLKYYFDNFYKEKQTINILEIGFGTGLNAFLTILENIKLQIDIYYESIEKFPLNDLIISKLNYANTDDEKLLFQTIHNAKWDKVIDFENSFYLHKRLVDLKTFISKKKFDIVYFDAFAPDKQPEMWTLEVFQNIFKHLNKNGILVTYSAKGSVRRTLIEAGFEVERIAGPPGKREMLRGKKGDGNC